MLHSTSATCQVFVQHMGISVVVNVCNHYSFSLIFLKNHRKMMKTRRKKATVLCSFLPFTCLCQCLILKALVLVTIFLLQASRIDRNIDPLLMSFKRKKSERDSE